MVTADELRQQGRAAGYEHDEVMLAERWPATVARRARFRFQWAMTRVHAFVFVVEVDHLRDEDLEALLDAAATYAKEHKGGLPRGLQTSTAAVSVIVADSLDDHAADTIRSPRKRFAILNFPAAVVGEDEHLVMREQRLLWGLLYDSWFRDLVDAHVPGAVPRPAAWVAPVVGWGLTLFLLLSIVAAVIPILL